MAKRSPLRDNKDIFKNDLLPARFKNQEDSQPEIQIPTRKYVSPQKLRAEKIEKKK